MANGSENWSLVISIHAEGLHLACKGNSRFVSNMSREILGTLPVYPGLYPDP